MRTRFGEQEQGKSRLELKKTMMGVEMNSFEGAEVIPFGESKILASPSLSAQFELAKNLMTQYQNGTKSASEIFDIDRLAKYYAIIDIMEAYHSNDLA